MREPIRGGGELEDGSPPRPRLQVAIDTQTAAEAVELAGRLQEAADLIEAGTPLIKRYGIGIVERLRAASGLPVVADLKIVDGGPFEARLAADAGAAMVTVLAMAADATIEGVVEVAQAHGVQVVADTIGVRDLAERIGELGRLGVDYLGVHAGTDARAHGGNTLAGDLDVARRVSSMPLVVAGGLGPATLAGVMGFRPAIVVVGSAITQAPDPLAVALELRMMVDG